jgi:dissimilatory sulfite reductase (desulfoviridin) alpha/beta subunit
MNITPKNGKLTPEQITVVKGLGCLRDKRYEDVFNVRVLTRNGKITTDEQRAIAEAADLYGSSSVAMTTRQTIEIQGVPYDKITDLIQFLKEHGLETGGTGAKVRPIVSCKGTTCQFGLIDTFSLAEKIHHRFYKGYHGVKLPHKFKIGVGGCPNNCVKPDLNDVGVIGQRIPVADLEKCRGCAVCSIEKACPVKNARLVNGKIDLASDTCNRCGRCIGKCPFGAVCEESVGYRVTVGGRWGKQVARGQSLSRLCRSEDEVLDLIEKCILFFRAYGVAGERFADTVARVGFSRTEEILFTDELLLAKNEILSDEK